jgi:hypothetical protein
VNKVNAADSFEDMVWAAGNILRATPLSPRLQLFERRAISLEADGSDEKNGEQMVGSRDSGDVEFESLLTETPFTPP